MIGDLRRLVGVALASVIVVGTYGTFRIWEQGGRDESRPAGAVVVLGAAQYDGRPSPVFAARLDHAVALYLTGAYRFLVVTGGKAAGDRTTEAAVAQAYAIDRGVPGDRILVEDRGRTTLESLEAVAIILRQHDIGDAVFVSDPPHMLRVLRMAADLSITAWGSATPTSQIAASPSRLTGAYVHELVALALYFTLGSAPAGELSESR
ncbi:MAG: YdcF family protein [Chloroflexota bacterium]